MRIVTASSIVVGRVTAALGVAGLWLLGTAPVLASPADQTPQDAGRSALLAAEREQKAAETSPPERSLVERTLYWYDNQFVLSKTFGGWKGFHLAGGDFPAGAGTKFGIGFTHGFGAGHASTDPARANRVDIDTFAASSTSGYKRGSAALKVRRLGGAPINLRVRGQRYEFPQEDFFGIGADSLTENRTDYLLESTEASADLQWTIAKRIDLGGGIAYVSPRIGTGTDPRFDDIDQLFDPSALPGFDNQSDFLRSDASVAFDWRDNPLHPHGGGRYSVQFSDFNDRDLNAFGFRRVAIDVQQYVPLPNRYRTLALRAAATMTDPHSGQDVPVFYQPTLGGSQALRGFREFRFRDRNSLVMTAEYRWEAWWALDGALFVDAGKVASYWRDLDFRDLDVSYGFGFRLHSNSAFTARLDLAFSREGFIPLLRFEHVF